MKNYDLIGEMAERGIDYRKVLSKIDIAPRSLVALESASLVAIRMSNREKSLRIFKN